MSSGFKKSIRQRDMPENFSKHTADTVRRIDDNHHVRGVLYLDDNIPIICTVSENLGNALGNKLSVFTNLVRNAVNEIDVLDELIAYQIESKTTELMLVPAGRFSACVLHKKSHSHAHGA